MSDRVRPFVKWAGGKGNLLSQMNNFYPEELKDGTIKRYVEPFVGGGAVLIDILKKYDVQEAYASDINIDLINSYNVIKNNVDELISILKEMEADYLELEQEKRNEYFYNIRDKYNSYELQEDEQSVERAAQFIFLNRTCFNGLYRVNKNGKFNVPIGRYKNPTICFEENLRNLSDLIQKVHFQYGDYKLSKKYITENTFVYFDPPYRPLNVTSGFTSYTRDGFTDENQRELAAFFREMHEKDAKLILTNSNPKNIDKNDNFFDEIYNGFNINEIYATRMINSNSKGRGKISELLVTSYN